MRNSKHGRWHTSSFLSRIVIAPYHKQNKNKNIDAGISLRAGIQMYNVAFFIRILPKVHGFQIQSQEGRNEYMNPKYNVAFFIRINVSFIQHIELG